MRIDAELDPVHSERLQALRRKLNKPLAEVLGVAIDTTLRHFEATPEHGASPLYAALDAIGFVGCTDADENLSADHKSHFNFADKTGTRS
jgi:hypothetical protein